MAELAARVEWQLFKLTIAIGSISTTLYFVGCFAVSIPVGFWVRHKYFAWTRCGLKTSADRPRVYSVAILSTLVVQVEKSVRCVSVCLSGIILSSSKVRDIGHRRKNSGRCDLEFFGFWFCNNQSVPFAALALLRFIGLAKKKTTYVQQRKYIDYVVKLIK